MAMIHIAIFILSPFFSIIPKCYAQYKQLASRVNCHWSKLLQWFTQNWS